MQKRCSNVLGVSSCCENDLDFVQIFCVHGGIPSPANGDGFIEAVNSIPVPLPDPEAESSLAWEMMWNDPVRYIYKHYLCYC